MASLLKKSFKLAAINSRVLQPVRCSWLGSTGRLFYSTDTASKDTGTSHKAQFRATGFNRKLLVWFGKYKSDADIPEFVSEEAINKAQSKARIYGNISMCLLLFIGIIFMIQKGRRDQEAGKNLSVQNMQRHPDVYKEAIEEGIMSKKKEFK